MIDHLIPYEPFATPSIAVVCFLPPFRLFVHPAERLGHSAFIRIVFLVVSGHVSLLSM